MPDTCFGVEPLIYTQTRPIEQEIRIPLANHGRPPVKPPLQKMILDEASQPLERSALKTDAPKPFEQPKPAQIVSSPIDR